MARFLNTRKAVSEIEDLIRNAGERLILVSPYLKISKDFKELLTFRNGKDKVTIIVIKFVKGNLPDHKYAGTSSTIQNVGNRLQATITIDTEYLNSATDLSLARTIIHESIHAMFYLGVDGGMGSAFTEANKLLYDGNGSYQQLPVQHQQMALNYVDEIATLLKSFANDQGITPPVPESERDEYYELLAYGGLHGADAWDDLNLDESDAQFIVDNEIQGNLASSRTSSC
jgi:hypothetical protein